MKVNLSARYFVFCFVVDIRSDAMTTALIIHCCYEAVVASGFPFLFLPDDSAQ